MRARFDEQLTLLNWDLIKMGSICEEGIGEQAENIAEMVIRMIAEKSEDVLDLLMIAKYSERIGDCAVNIAEWVVYAVTGLHEGVNQ